MAADASSVVVPSWGLYQKEVPVKGRAVFPTKQIAPGQLVLKFEGPIYDKATCPDFSEALQVGINAWMWSSGGLDDLVNHSCNPNCGIVSLGGGFYLKSLRTIEPEEELSFDYSTSMVDEPWGMDCACGEASCRGHVGNFIELPAATQHKYARFGVLPEHTRTAYLTRGAGRDEAGDGYALALGGKQHRASSIGGASAASSSAASVASTASAFASGASVYDSDSDSVGSISSADSSLAGTPTSAGTGRAGVPGSISRGFALPPSSASGGAAQPTTTDVKDWGLYAMPVPVKGRAVFAGKPIPANHLVLKFEGPIYDKATCPDFSEAIQVGINAWMWSSGGLDDLVNHSCNPNCGLYPHPADGGLYLLALRPILPGEELSFDYSTSMVDEPWGMDCACGEASCRGHVGNFIDIPAARQHDYARRGVLPEHVRLAYLTRGAGAHNTNSTSSTTSSSPATAGGSGTTADGTFTAGVSAAAPVPVVSLPAGTA